ncbi:fibronectin type III domain-containing protein [Paludisphaera soli]|uniref:fibronectin type III domain-containing protein n=1 Tax=Paludisphaera soli TaxID=2712865 RepID=UPI0013EBFBF4|nr:fibronectin type III domain-containing protein [Paludisphaera soli]
MTTGVASTPTPAPAAVATGRQAANVDPDDPDDTIRERVTDFGLITAGRTPTAVTDALGLLDAPRAGMSRGEFIRLNAQDVDLYRFQVEDGARLRFRVETWATSTPFPKQKPIKGSASVALKLFDADGVQMPAMNLTGPAQVSTPLSGSQKAGRATWQLDYTFFKAGTYYLGISHSSSRKYDPAGGGGDNPSRSHASFGPYKLDVDYLETDLPDLSARELWWDGDVLRLRYDVTQEAVPSRLWPGEWRHGVALRWLGADGRDLGTAAADGLESYNSRSAIPSSTRQFNLHLTPRELGEPPAGATHLAMILNSDGSVPETDSGNNTKVVSLDPSRRLVDIRVVRADAIDDDSLVLHYEVSGDRLRSGPLVGLYRGAGPSFDGDAELIATIPLPSRDRDGEETGVVGSHAVDVVFPARFGGTVARPYLFVVIDPSEEPPTPATSLSVGSEIETDESNNATRLGVVTLDQLRQVMASASDATLRKYLEPLNRTLGEFGIVTHKRQAAFLAQVRLETKSLEAMTEDLDYKAKRLTEVWPKRFPTLASTQGFAHNPPALAEEVYGGRYGNDAAGDGWRYIGRGFIHLTFKSNYRAASIGLYEDERLVWDPWKVARDPIAAARVGGWFWDHHGLNAHADRYSESQKSGAGTARSVSDGISKVVNTYDKDSFDVRLGYFEKALDVLRPADPGPTARTVPGVPAGAGEAPPLVPVTSGPAPSAASVALADRQPRALEVAVTGEQGVTTVRVDAARGGSGPLPDDSSTDSARTRTTPTSPFLAAPSAPTRLRADDVRTTMVDLIWDDRSGDVTGFRVAVRRDGEDWRHVGTTVAGDADFRVAGLEPGTRYWFKVRAANGEAYSDYTNEIMVVTDLEPPVGPTPHPGPAEASTPRPEPSSAQAPLTEPVRHAGPIAAPAGLRADTIWATKVDLKWDHDSTGGSGYRVEISLDGVHFAESRSGQADKASFRWTELKPRTRYWFRVAALDAKGASRYSTVIEVRTRS